MTLFDEDASFHVSPGVHGASVLPPNAIREARSVDEYRYLAGLAVYLTASEAAASRARGARSLLGLGALGTLAAIAVAPVAGILVDPVLAATTGATANAFTRGGAGAQSAIFASTILADMGGDPRAGLELVTRLERTNVKAPGVLLSEGGSESCSTP